VGEAIPARPQSRPRTPFRLGSLSPPQGRAITIGTIVIVPRIGGGPGRVRDSVRYLADNDLLEVGRSKGRIRIGVGTRARKS
jgi:hypothetical protein